MNTQDTIRWTSFWDEKAKEPTDFQATGRGGMDVIGFLYTLNEIVTKLELKKTDSVLDIGCGTGIIALSLSPWVKRIHGVDISPKMIKRARKNSAYVDNVTFSIGDVNDLNIKAGEYDRVLAYSVLQYLSDEAEVLKAFNSLKRILPPAGRALYSANPDPAKLDDYINNSLKQEMNCQERQRAMKIIDATLWLSPVTMISLAKEAGLRAEARPICQSIWQHFYMFDLVLYHG